MSEKRAEIQGILNLVRVMGFGVLLCIKKTTQIKNLKPDNLPNISIKTQGYQWNLRGQNLP